VRTQPHITFYCTVWCPDCHRTARLLNKHKIDYTKIDIDRDPEAKAYVREINDGKQIVPTIVFEDGSILVEPSNRELLRKIKDIKR
jgi:glutaredoxin-like protein